MGEIRIKTDLGLLIKPVLESTDINGETVLETEKWRQLRNGQLIDIEVHQSTLAALTTVTTMALVRQQLCKELSDQV